MEEIARVDATVTALRGGDLATVGRLLNASHRSSQTLFENSTPELDFLVHEDRTVGALRPVEQTEHLVPLPAGRADRAPVEVVFPVDPVPVRSRRIRQDRLDLMPERGNGFAGAAIARADGRPDAVLTESV